MLRLYLAGQDVPESWEGVVQGLVVNGLVQIFDEDISHSWLAEGRVSLWPHDPDGLALHHIEVHRVQSSFGYNTKFLLWISVHFFYLSSKTHYKTIIFFKQIYIHKTEQVSNCTTKPFCFRHCILFSGAIIIRPIPISITDLKCVWLIGICLLKCFFIV